MSCVNVPYRWQTQAGGMQRGKEGRKKRSEASFRISVPIKTKPSEAGSF